MLNNVSIKLCISDCVYQTVWSNCVYQTACIRQCIKLCVSDCVNQTVWSDCVYETVCIKLCIKPCVSNCVYQTVWIRLCVSDSVYQTVCIKPCVISKPQNEAAWAQFGLQDHKKKINTIRVKETKRKAVTILLSDQTPPNNKYHYWIPMTPQANLPPALPVFRLSSVPPFPRSSVPLCTTRARPITLCGPCSEMILSVILMVATPVGPASTLPRSPTWRSVSLGSPWFFYKQRSHGDPITSASSACACKWEQKLQNKATRVLLCSPCALQVIQRTARFIVQVTFATSFHFHAHAHAQMCK